MDERVLELAEAQYLATVDDRVAKIREKVKPRDPDFDGRCVECGDPIPDQRVQLGAATCIDGQEHLEREERLRR